MSSEVEELKEATRRAHEAIKDLKLIIRETKEVGDEVRKLIHDEIHTRIDKEVARGLGEYKSTISDAIEDATDRITKRFDYLAELLMGEDKKSKRKGLKAIPEYVEEIAETDTNP